MIALIVGLSASVSLIIILVILKQNDKQLPYALILSGIAFLYIGFTWADLVSLIITSIQAFVFLLLAYYGVKKSLHVLATGYFFHGCWDFAYSFFDKPGLIPPHYDVFCLSFDFIIGIYLLVIARTARSTF